MSKHPDDSSFDTNNVSECSSPILMQVDDLKLLLNLIANKPIEKTNRTITFKHTFELSSKAEQRYLGALLSPMRQSQQRKISAQRKSM